MRCGERDGGWTVADRDIAEIEAALREITRHNPAPWHTNSSARWNVEDARGRDVALAQMQIGDPREGQPRRTALAQFLAAAPDVIAYLLERVRVAEARLHETESRTEVVGG